MLHCPHPSFSCAVMWQSGKPLGKSTLGDLDCLGLPLYPEEEVRRRRGWGTTPSVGQHMLPRYFGNMEALVKRVLAAKPPKVNVRVTTTEDNQLNSIEE